MITGIEAVFRSIASQSAWLRGATLDPVLSGALRAVERLVGGSNNLLGVRLRTSLGHPEAGGDAETGRAGDRPARKPRPDAFGELHRAVLVGTREQEQELFSTPAPSNVRVAKRLAEDV